MNKHVTEKQGSTRRQFIQTSAALGAAAWAIGGPAFAQNADPIRIGLVGCGRRGIGAVQDCVNSSPNVQLVAIADVFEDQLATSRERFEGLGDANRVTDDTAFAGFDAYKQVVAADVDVVLICSPPGFHPDQYQACVDAGKHVFMEKPGAVDVAGVRKLLATTEQAREKGLSVVSGTQRRHQEMYLEMMRRIHEEGAIGDVVAAQCYWVGGYDYYTPPERNPEWSDMEWQLRNWNYYCWLSGDHIVEQHLHNIDVMHWVFGANPIKCYGIGGRQQRVGPQYGHIFDHFTVEFEYPGDVRVQSLCRQQSNSDVSRVEEHIVGTKGYVNTGSRTRGIYGENPYRYEPEGQPPNPYVQEHTNLIASIREGRPINEGKNLAESTLAAIMGRMACYTGQEVTWEWALNESQENLLPERLEMGPMPEFPVAVPGRTELV